MSSERSLIDEGYAWIPLFYGVSLSLLRYSLSRSILCMEAQEVIKHYTILEEAAPNLFSKENVQFKLASIALVNKHTDLRYAEELFRFWEKPVLSLKRIYESSFVNPGLIGDYSLQLETVLKAGDLAVTRIVIVNYCYCRIGNC